MKYNEYFNAVEKNGFYYTDKDTALFYNVSDAFNFTEQLNKYSDEHYTIINGYNIDDYIVFFKFNNIEIDINHFTKILNFTTDRQYETMDFIYHFSCMLRYNKKDFKYFYTNKYFTYSDVCDILDLIERLYNCRVIWSETDLLKVIKLK